MRYFIAASALLAGALAQSNYPNQSAPFNLQLVSDDASLDGVYLTACHTGAAIESLCTYKADTPTQFFVNSTLNTQDPSVNKGLLTWDLRGSNFVTNQPMIFSYDVASNVALPLMEFGTYGVQIIFDDADKLGVQSGVDDSVSPPVYNTDLVTLNRWYICQTLYAGYSYQNLAWALGAAAPQNPSCKKVDVKRTFVGGYGRK